MLSEDVSSSKPDPHLGTHGTHVTPHLPLRQLGTTPKASYRTWGQGEEELLAVSQDSITSSH